jgi:hypothetical protein
MRGVGAFIVPRYHDDSVGSVQIVPGWCVSLQSRAIDSIFEATIPVRPHFSTSVDVRMATSTSVSSLDVILEELVGSYANRRCRHRLGRPDGRYTYAR